MAKFLLLHMSWNLEVIQRKLRALKSLHGFAPKAQPVHVQLKLALAENKPNIDIWSKLPSRK